MRPEIVVIPAKGLVTGKSRLMGVLAPSARRALNRVQLLQTVRAAAAAFGHAQTFVVSPCVRVEAVARSEGVGFLREQTPPGLNGALEQARAELLGGHPAPLCILPVDLPGVSERVLRELLAGRAAGSAFLVPDRAGAGTNFMRLPAGCAMAFSYGPGSFSTHARLMTQAGYVPEIVTATCLRDDLDDPQHLRLHGMGRDLVAA